MSSSNRQADLLLPGLEVPGPHADVISRLTEVAGALGGRVALESDGRSVTYADLLARVRALGAQLAATEAVDSPPDREPLPVGVLAEQSVDSVAAVLSVLASGRPCVLLDVLLPDSRVEQIAERAGLRTVLADDAHREIAAQLAPVRTVRGLLPEDGAPSAALPEHLPAAASIVFTSGSTGVPKGVVLEHRTLLAAALMGRERFGHGPGERVALVLPYAFAAGQELIVMALLNGATLCIRDPRVGGTRDFAEWVGASRVTTLHCTPSLLRSLIGALPADSALDSVRLVTTCGEKVYGADVEAARAHLPAGAVFANWFGSSETASLTTFEIGPGDPVPDGVVPAGRAVPLREFVLLDDDGRPVAPGETGVLHVVSDHLSGGYWRDAGETTKRFEPLPDGRIRYRTGDRVRIGEDGVLEVLGRADDSVKIRGYLVEPADVETALRSLPAVVDGVVRAVPGDDGARLVAWVIPSPDDPTPSPADLRAGLARTLPDWMVPRDIVLLSELPRNERGKLDVSALPQPPARPEPVPPRSATEQHLERVWSAILHLDRVGRDESFTALGGDSLAVEEMLEKVRESYEVSLVSADLAEHATLQDFAALVDAARRGRPTGRLSTLVTLRTDGSRPPVLCFAGAGGAAAFFGALADALGPDQPVYAFQANGFENRGLPDWTVARAARRYVRVIEEIAPEGPVALVGHSLGGLIALKVAHLLNAKGRSVPLVTVLDTFVPPAGQGPDGSRLTPTNDVPLPRRELWATRLRILGAGVVDYPPAVRTEVFHQHGVRVARLHRPTPWPGRALVFLSRENRDDTGWWRRLLPGQLTIHRLDCDHAGLLKPPHVGQVAERVGAALDAALDSMAGDGVPPSAVAPGAAGPGYRAGGHGVVAGGERGPDH